MRSSNGRVLLSPSDLNDYVGCEHHTTLARQVALGEREKPHVADEGAKLLADKGMAHELDFLARMHEEGRDVVEIAMDDRWDFEAAASPHARGDARRRRHHRAGDVRRRSMAGPGRLPAADAGNLEARARGATKRSTRSSRAPRSRPTCCSFASTATASTAIQGARPEHMHVFLGVGEKRTFRYDDFAAYYRRVRARFESAVSFACARPRPIRSNTAALCEFHGVCKDRWRAEDSLVLVAGARRAQVVALRDAGLPTLKALAQARPGTKVPRGRAARVRRRCATRRRCSSSGARPDGWIGIASTATAGRGFALLPRPSPGDVIFDIEGDPFWEPARGLHFLFGLLLRDGTDWEYRPMWAHDRAGERQMFEDFIDLVHARLGADPRCTCTTTARTRTRRSSN